MHDDIKSFLVGVVMGFLLGAMLVLNVAVSIRKSENAEAIKRGYKVYDTKTGELKWKESDDAE